VRQILETNLPSVMSIMSELEETRPMIFSVSKALTTKLQRCGGLSVTSNQKWFGILFIIHFGSEAELKKIVFHHDH